MARKHLIIGAGKAALSAAEAIRRITWEDEVKLVSMEDCLPYSPAGLTYLLSGRIAESALWLRDEEHLSALACTLVPGKEVVRVLPERKEVGYRDGSTERYDTLLVASGAEPLRPAIEGLEETGVHDFRTVADCRRLLRELGTKQKVAVLGGGMVGMGIAAALSERGCNVRVLEREANILSAYFDGEAEAYIRQAFEERGVRFSVASRVTEVRRKGGTIEISLSDGTTLDAEILVNATGVRSRIGFLEGAGLSTASGILVDRRMNTGVNHVYAAGDAAQAQDFFTGASKVNAILPGAVEQGRVAGSNMAGVDEEYEGAIPMTAFHFFGNRAFSLGLLGEEDNDVRVVKQKDDRRRKFKKLLFHGDTLVGGTFLNETVDPGIVHRLIRKRTNLAPHREALFEKTRSLSDPWLRSLRF